MTVRLWFQVAGFVAAVAGPYGLGFAAGYYHSIWLGLACFVWTVTGLAFVLHALLAAQPVEGDKC